jgi:CRP-like cAMP-binding protein
MLALTMVEVEDCVSIEQPNVVDGIATDPVTGEVVLLLSDHLAWDDSEPEHLMLLQEKVNTYLRFIESGELVEHYPNALGRRAVIEVVCLHTPGDQARRFFAAAGDVITDAGFALRYRVSPAQ